LLTNSKEKKQQPKEEFRVYKKWDPFDYLGTDPKEEKPSTTLLSNSKTKTATKLTTKKRLHTDTRFDFTSQMHVISVKSSSLLFQILQYSCMHAVLRTASGFTSVLSKKHLSTSSNQNMMVHIVDAYTENLQFGVSFTLVNNEWQRGIFTVM
jgi:hypothetical protein